MNTAPTKFVDNYKQNLFFEIVKYREIIREGLFFFVDMVQYILKGYNSQKIKEDIIMKKLISILLILLMSLATLISCEFSTKKDNEKETDESEKSVQSDTVNTDDELIPIHPNDCDNVDQELSSKLKKAFANAKKTDPSEIPITFYIKIEDCHIFRITDLMTDNMCYREIAGYTIEYGGYSMKVSFENEGICRNILKMEFMREKSYIALIAFQQ